MLKSKGAAFGREAALVWHKPQQLNQNHIYKRTASVTSSSRLKVESIDEKWRRRWGAKLPTPIEIPEESRKPKKYILSMFPYPSGSLHIGHLRVYTISDVLARFNHMRGYDVLHPMAWDAFGLPAENAAIERGVDPAEWTTQNISKMKAQLLEINAGFDWCRECNTSSPSYYKHTQRIFLWLHEHGHAYRAESLVNYDPVDKTVLANEQVDANGFSWRSGAKVEKVKLKQWFLRITAFKESLLADLESLAKDNRWPERVLSMQHNWLGRSRGAIVKFEILHGQDLGASTQVKVFTTRPDTLFGAQYVALALDHPLVVSLSESNSDLKAFINRAPSLPLDSKEGFLLPGFYASNPLSILASSPDRTRIALPVYAAPYVLGSYGEGAIMGVPGHDGRDHAFWKQNRGDEAILRVVDPVDSNGRANVRKRESRVAAKPFEGSGKLNWLCGKLSGFSSAQASQLIVEELSRTGELAMQVETWRLRDWLISRQRYWGTPIPIIYCESCGTVPVPVDQLPVELPALKGDWFKSKSGNPLEATDEWVNTTCPTCKGKATRETDTMDTFMDSSWYFMRLIDPHNTIHPFSTEAAEKYLPVDIYVGGVEHAILHLLYARFISKFFASTSLWPSGGGEQNKGEPFRRLVSQGMVHGKTFSDPENGRFLKPEEIDLSNPSEPKISSSGQAANISWEKMSKSKYNGVDPTECIRKYGADAARAHILFQAPASEVLNWEEERITGIQRWFARVWRVTQDTKHKAEAYDELLTSPSTGKAPFNFPIPDPASFTKSESYTWSQVQRTILSVTRNLSETFTLNTIISDLMELTNTLLQSKEGCNPRLQFHAVSALLRMMAPVTPAVAEECWEELHSIRLGLEPESNNNEEVPIIIPPNPNPLPSIPSIFESPFPTFDSSLAAIESQSQTCVIQENGKWRLAVEIAKPSQELMEEGKEDELREWVLRQIEATPEGRIWSQKKKKIQQHQHGSIMTWKRIIVVGGGKVVNFVQ